MQNKIPFLNLKKAYLELKPQLDQLWQDINEDSIYILDARLEQFEKEFADYLGVKHVIGVANGLDALVLSLKALAIGPGDEVIVPAHTFIATWLAISATGAQPVPVEIDETTYLLDSSKIKDAITDKTRAIMPVHLYGRVCDMENILQIAEQYGLKVIEDAAQAHGAIDRMSGKKAGALGHVAGFSFYPGKNLGCFGDGGCVATNDSNLAQQLQLLRNYGSKVRYEHEVIGGNSRLDELQAGVLSIKLKHLDEWNSRRQDIAKIYLQELNHVGDIVLPEYSIDNVWHIFPIQTARRDELQKFLSSQEIYTNIHYPKPLHLQNAYLAMDLKQGTFPISEKMCSQELSLPMGPHLMTQEAIRCAQKVKEFFN